MSSASLHFAEVEELVLEVLQHCDIASLVGASNGNRQSRRLTRSILSTCLVQALSSCIPHHLLLQFFALLDRTEAAIAGSMALKTLTPYCAWDTVDVNIITPLYSFQPWADFFTMHHYITSEDDKFVALQDTVRQAGIWYYDDTKHVRFYFYIRIFFFTHDKNRRKKLPLSNQSINLCFFLSFLCLSRVR